MADTDVNISDPEGRKDEACYEEASQKCDRKSRTKGKRKTRAQRRKEKAQKLRSEQQRQSGQEPQKYDDRVIVKDNPNLVKYYRLQTFITSDEFDAFMESLKTTLPASFRINTFDYGQARFLRQLVQGPEFQEFLKNASQETNATASMSSPILEPLLWYPKKLAWQMNITRVDLKKSPILQKLHRFIMAETDNGFISRQESVSMIPPLVLDIQRGHNILDMCAAPGSKTAQLLEYLTFNIHGKANHRSVKDEKPIFDDGLVVANDVDNKRCYMLVHQSNRLNSPNCVIINEDASKLPKMKSFVQDGDEYCELKFDRILCDAPCSGDGTVRKNPDVWRKWTTGNANNFHGLQSKILKRGVELLKENGLIVYSTCSMNPVEDEAVVSSILRLSQGRVVLEDCSKRLEGLKYRPGINKWVVMNRDMEIINNPDEVKPEQISQIHASLFPPTEEEVNKFNLHRCIRVVPHIQNTGAFFVAVLKKLTPSLPWEDSQGPTEPESTGGREQHKKQPNPKKRRYGGFREDPFVFIEPDDPDWYQIRDFYGLSQNFPVNQLVHRCPSGKKRSIHLVSKATRSFMIANREEPNRSDFVKLINGGMRLFAKAETEAGFRICQDGVNEILPYVKDDLKVSITRDDLRLLLERKSVPMDMLSSGLHLREKLKPGSCILMYKYEKGESVDSDSSYDVEDGDSIEMPLVAWRGEHCTTLYVSNTYRIHLSALIHLKIGDINVEDANGVQVTTKA